MKLSITIELLTVANKGRFDEGLSYGGRYWTVPELLFEKKQLIPTLQRLIASFQRPTA